MQADIPVSNLYWNDRLRGFFFRSQAEWTFNEVVERTINSPQSEEQVCNLLESLFTSVDEMEEYFYEMDAEKILDEMREYGIEVEEYVED